MQTRISSTQNKAIKHLLQLQEKSRLRKKENLFIIEGARELALAIKGGYKIKEVYYNPELFATEKVEQLLQKNASSNEILEISSEVYQKIAYRGSTEGIIAVAHAKEMSLSQLQLNAEEPLILIAEAPEKPGNIGALLRTADAARVDAVFIANLKTDLYNPNIIRSSVGCVFTNNIATGSTTEIIEYLKERKIAIFGASLQAAMPYYKINFTKASAIVVGTEATGLTNAWLENTTQNIVIPMHGEIDSMNVSVAAGILIFEAKRQREVGVE